MLIYLFIFGVKGLFIYLMIMLTRDVQFGDFTESNGKMYKGNGFFDVILSFGMKIRANSNIKVQGSVHCYL